MRRIPPPVGRHPENRLHFGNSVTDPKCSKCAWRRTLRCPNRKNVIFLHKNIFGAPKLISEYFVMILNRFSNGLRGENRGNARARLEISKILDFHRFATRGVLALIWGGFWKSPKLKRKFPSAGFSTHELIFYF